MDLPVFAIERARARGLFRNVRTFFQVEPELFLVRGKRAFYVTGSVLDLRDLGLREERAGRHSL